MVLVLASLLIISNNNLHVTQQGDRENFFTFFEGWAVNTFHNLKSVTKEAFELDWIP